MTNEASLNTIISNSFSLLTGGKAFKISDPAGGMGSQNPFDHFGVFHGCALYSESKLIKNDIQSLQFSRIEEHQIANLKFFKENIKNCYTLIFLGIYIPNKMKKILVFDFGFIYDQIQSGKKSFLKKELLLFLEKGMFLDINYTSVLDENHLPKRKEVISDLQDLDSKIIRGF